MKLFKPNILDNLLTLQVKARIWDFTLMVRALDFNVGVVGSSPRVAKNVAFPNVFGYSRTV